jgi:tetratricopeptide (TPR) repeat protein
VTDWRRRLRSLVVMLALFAASVWLQRMREATYPGFEPVESVLYVSSGALLSRAVLSFDALAADVYWVRAVQHFGGTRRSTGPKRYELLHPLLDIATTLDPLFTVAYRFGAIFLAEPPPGGPGRADLAVALLEKGGRASPDRWQYLYDIAFVHYWWRRDYPAAAEYFKRAADVPGAPWWLESMAATTLAQGGNREASRALWRTLLESGESEWLRNDAVRRLQQLDALDQIDALTRVVDRYREAGADKPYSWRAVVAAGYLRGTPLDPAGIPYYLGPFTGSVDLGDDSPLHPLPLEPPPVAARPGS